MPIECRKHQMRDKFVNVKIKSANPCDPLSPQQFVGLQNARNTVFEVSMKTRQQGAPAPDSIEVIYWSHSNLT